MRGTTVDLGTARVGRIAALATGAALVGLFAAPSVAGASPAPQGEVRVVVQLTGDAARHAPDLLGALPGSLPRPVVADRWTLTVPAGEVAATLARLHAERGVTYASAAHTVHATDLGTVPNDPCYAHSCGPVAPTVLDPDVGGQTTASQPDLAQVDAPGAWAVTHGSPSVLVAVLDTGVDAEHQDLSADVTAGPDIVCPTADATGPSPTCTQPNGGDPSDTDGNGHGTHVTGTIAARSDDGTGVASLGWATHAETFAVLDSSGSGSTIDVATGIYEAVASGAAVINMSLGDDPCVPGLTPSGGCGSDPDTQAAVEYALAHDVVVVAAAGNAGSPLGSYPASYPGVLSVAAVNGAGQVDGYSDWGDSADIAAPGDRILSTWNVDASGTKSTDTYAVLTGTSMASPHVAAAAALVRAAAPSLSAAQVTSVLETTATPTRGGNPIAGGVLDAGAAVRAALGAPVYSGYRLATVDGDVGTFGASPYLGGLTGVALSRPIVTLASTPDQTGYWEVGSDGGVFSFGSAGYFGSTGGVRLARPIVGMAPTADGRGYWLVASDGGIFAFGDARFSGSTGGVALTRPIVGMAATPDGGGYWMVGSDGGVFSFGDARFFGSTGGLRLDRPIVGMAATPDGGGYQLVASDGGIFTYGDARFYGSTGGVALTKPIVGALPTSDGGGYWLVATDGGVFSFGDARFDGSAGGLTGLPPIVAIG